MSYGHVTSNETSYLSVCEPLQSKTTWVGGYAVNFFPSVIFPIYRELSKYLPSSYRFISNLVHYCFAVMVYKTQDPMDPLG